MNRLFGTGLCALAALSLTLSAQAPSRATGDQRRQYVFAPTGQQMPYRVYVPKTWDGKASLPIILMLHGAGANEGTYLDQADGLLMKLAEQHGYIVVSPLGFSPLGAYGNPLRLPAVFGQPAAAASQRAAVTPARQRELNLSELEVMTALDIVTEEYGADRARTFLASNSGPLFSRKWTVWEGGIRVPAIVKWPGRIRAGSVSDQPAITFDWSASILAAAGVPVPVSYEGINLFPILEGRAPKQDRRAPRPYGTEARHRPSSSTPDQ